MTTHEWPTAPVIKGVFAHKNTDGKREEVRGCFAKGSDGAYLDNDGCPYTLDWGWFEDVTEYWPADSLRSMAEHRADKYEKKWKKQLAHSETLQNALTGRKHRIEQLQELVAELAARIEELEGKTAKPKRAWKAGDDINADDDLSGLPHNSIALTNERASCGCRRVAVFTDRGWRSQGRAGHLPTKVLAPLILIYIPEVPNE